MTCCRCDGGAREVVFYFLVMPKSIPISQMQAMPFPSVETKQRMVPCPLCRQEEHRAFLARQETIDLMGAGYDQT